MMSEQPGKAELFKTEIQGKIKNLLQEFVDGKISREQFNILYERYDVQLSLANEAIAAKQGGGFEEMAGGMSTFAVRKATEGKAVGLAIYHHRSGTFIETLGDFDAGPKETTPILSELSLKMETHEYVEPMIRSIRKGVWLMFASRDYTTVITMFRNEPSPQQVKEIVRLHHDFEEANKRLLGANMIHANKLAVPFLAFVQKKLGGR